ncbi:6-carboxytetrahydropterin synthase [Streptomyces sp. NPDC059578]|uniref:6-carboxytetrahydropterin synthase n=1 Tax=unclassified Streptomyces TaxID=2593676 RepID=UPI0036618AA8
MAAGTETAYFSATHTERDLPPGHPCAGVAHSHLWTVTLEAVSPNGSAEDLTDRDRAGCAEFAAWAQRCLDGTHLNAVAVELCHRAGPEELARWVYRQWSARLPVREVRVQGPYSGSYGAAVLAS